MVKVTLPSPAFSPLPILGSICCFLKMTIPQPQFWISDLQRNPLCFQTAALPGLIWTALIEDGVRL